MAGGKIKMVHVSGTGADRIVTVNYYGRGGRGIRVRVFSGLQLQDLPRTVLAYMARAAVVFDGKCWTYKINGEDY